MPDLARIKLLAMDVDGVMTDGRIIVNSDGTETKFFNVHDGHGIRLWHRAGLATALISGRASAPTARRAKQLEIEHVFEDCHFKLPVIQQLLAETGLAAENVAYIGDDLPDLPVMRFVGFAVAVANAVDLVKQHADYVTERPGGHGAVREVIEHILKGGGKWPQLMDRYLTDS